MNIRQLVALCVVLLMLHPGLDPLRAQQQGVRVAAQVGPVVGQSATLLPDGRLLVVGGSALAGVQRGVGVRQGPALAPLGISLKAGRAWHTATVLPTGEVLVVGGYGSGGLVGGAEIVDPVGLSFREVSALVDGRAYHTATVLTDGRVLLAGGVFENGEVSSRLELFDAAAGTLTRLPVGLLVARRGHAARLLVDGNVLISGGQAADGSRPGDEVLRVADFSMAAAAELAPDAGEFGVAGSWPENGAAEVVFGSWMGIRFTRLADVGSVNAATVTMKNGGPMAARVVAAESGMVAFVTPSEGLKAGTEYTVLLSGVRDAGGFPLGVTELRFTTAGGGPAEVTAATVSQTTPAPGRPQLPPKEDPAPAPLQGAAGVTAVAGLVRTIFAKPLPGARVELDCSGKLVVGVTDSLGRFLLGGVAAGRCQLEVDGVLAKDPEDRNPQFDGFRRFEPGRSYGGFIMGVDVVAGRTNVLPYTVWMTPIDRGREAAVEVAGVAREQVITHPDLKGLELRLPPNSVIRDAKGKIVNRVSITPVPAGRTPFPMPKNVAFATYFTIQPGGAYVEVGGARYAPGRGATLVYPNKHRAPAGTKFNFWTYDPENGGWHVYGTGRVTADRRSIVPDAGVVIGRFTGAMVAEPNFAPPNGPNPSCDTNNYDGDPIELCSGMFLEDNTDLSLPDVLPIAVSRSYRPGDHLSRAFGIGTSHTYDMFIVGNIYPYTYVDVILPDGARIHYDRTSSGTGPFDAVYEHTTSATRFIKSKVSWNGNGWDLRLKDGMVYTFPDSSGVTLATRAALNGIKDRYGNRVTLQREAVTGNLLRITSPNGRWIGMTYDGSARITQMQDNGGRTYSYQYDEGGRLWRVTNPLGGVTEYTYDANNQMLTKKDPRGNFQFTNEYAVNGRVTRQTLANGGVYQVAYVEDGNGNVTQVDVTNPRGYIRRGSYILGGYFSGGLLQSERKALGQTEEQVTTYERFAGTNSLRSTIDPIGRKTTYGYDPSGNLITETKLADTANAVTTTMTYDPAFNQLASVTDPLGHTIVYAYDSLGRLTAITNAVGQQTASFSYSATGELIAATDGLGTTTFARSGGFITSIADPLARTTRFVHDTLGRVITTTDSLGGVQQLSYDAMDNIARSIDPLGTSTQVAYDANRNLTTLTDGRNNTNAFNYDAANRLTGRVDPLLRGTGKQYGSTGDMTQIVDRKGGVAHADYDALDRLKTITYADFSTITYSYDGAGRLVQIADSSNGNITRSYDGLDRLITESTAQGTVSYTYDADGRRATLAAPGQSIVNYSYDDADRVTGITQGSLVATMEYGSSGKRTVLTLPNQIRCEYTYDGGGRLMAVVFRQSGVLLGDMTYQYDENGRISARGGSLARVVIPQALSGASYNAANEIVTWNGINLVYDANGNLLNDGVNSYAWNARNELTAITGNVSAGFQYDGSRRRRSRTIGSDSTTFLYDGLSLLQDSGSGGITSYFGGMQVDSYFARTSNGATKTLLGDVVDSVFALVNASGVMETQYAYTPHGAALQIGSTTGNTITFVGRETDSTGLIYNRARYYSPSLQRFVSEDPSEHLGGINLYSYADNDPVSLVDPFGLTTFRCGRPMEGYPGWTASTPWSHSYVCVYIDGRRQCAGLIPNVDTPYPWRYWPATPVDEDPSSPNVPGRCTREEPPNPCRDRCIVRRMRIPASWNMYFHNCHQWVNELIRLCTSECSGPRRPLTLR